MCQYGKLSDKLTIVQTEYQPPELPDVPPAIMRRVGALLSLAAQAAQEAGNQALAPLGLSVRHFAILTFLRHQPEHPPRGHRRRVFEPEPNSEASAFSQQAIGERLRIDRSTMVTVIDDLERAGFVRRERNPDDRRAYVIKLTPQGARMQARAEKALDALMNDLYLAPLSNAERQKLTELLTRLVERSEQRGASSTSR